METKRHSRLKELGSAGPRSSYSQMETELNAESNYKFVSGALLHVSKPTFRNDTFR